MLKPPAPVGVASGTGVDGEFHTHHLLGRQSGGPTRERRFTLTHRALHVSEVARLEVWAGMRTGEEAIAPELLEILIWHPLDTRIANMAGGLGRRWLRSGSFNPR